MGCPAAGFARLRAGVAVFDGALTVCAMRYVSDLRVGRIGLNAELKKYDLAQFQPNLVLGRHLSFLKGLADPHAECVTIQALSDVCTKIDIVLRA